MNIERQQGHNSAFIWVKKMTDSKLLRVNEEQKQKSGFIAERSHKNYMHQEIFRVLLLQGEDLRDLRIFRHLVGGDRVLPVDG